MKKVHATDPSREAVRHLTAGDRRGFTLVELLVVTVIGTVLLGAVYQVLVSNQRTYTVQQAQVQNQQTLRSALDLLAGELRTVSVRSPNDLLDLEEVANDRIQIRGVRTAAHICVRQNLPASVNIVRFHGPPFDETVADAVIFVEGDPDTRADDFYAETQILSVEPLVHPPCGDGPTARINLAAGLWGPGAVRPGAPIYNLETREYGPVTFEGATYLGRGMGGPLEPAVGPLAPVNPIRFEYLDAQGNTVANPQGNRALIRQVRITLRAQSPVRTAGGDLVADSLTTLVHLRN